jgi:hypothetical protein
MIANVDASLSHDSDRSWIQAMGFNTSGTNEKFIPS